MNLQKIKCPILLTHGDRDGFMNVLDIFKMAEYIDNVAVYIAPNGGHDHHRKQSDVFLKIVINCINNQGK